MNERISASHCAVGRALVLVHVHGFDAVAQLPGRLRALASAAVPAVTAGWAGLEYVGVVVARDVGEAQILSVVGVGVGGGGGRRHRSTVGFEEAARGARRGIWSMRRAHTPGLGRWAFRLARAVDWRWRAR